MNVADLANNYSVVAQPQGMLPNPTHMNTGDSHTDMVLSTGNRQQASLEDHMRNCMAMMQSQAMPKGMP